MAIPTLFRPRSLGRRDESTDMFEQMMQRLFDEFPMETSGAGYPVDIREEDGHLIVDAEMPGFKSDEIDVSVADDMLTIRAERSAEKPKGRPHLQERHFTRVQRSFRLPSTVDPDSVDAKLEGGVLHLDMKQSESERIRRIKVN
ncbi:Hsp20/alpha crystallin family protein [Thioalkalivibrio sp.]|uniref:Hsp20/alpha crystallin family protein n=1 Tax=Thioalkalivibrio sp. TaxID=2093813 RepID=UPI0012D69F1A|nr:Hsp20/alpha crystallin family protein [Thioalkalivibrio sp.]TVP79319.1 MAG: Hsp20/alpha crystallin family protein [Thioalkalivibrio sp.]